MLMFAMSPPKAKTQRLASYEDAVYHAAELKKQLHKLGVHELVTLYAVAGLLHHLGWMPQV